MTEKRHTLHVSVRSLQQSIDHAKEFVRAYKNGTGKELPYESIGFASTIMALKLLTIRRIELIQNVRELGPVSIRSLSKVLARDYRNVYSDVAELFDAGFLCKDDRGKFFVPWDTIQLDMKIELPPASQANRNASRKRYHPSIEEIDKQLCSDDHLMSKAKTAPRKSKKRSVVAQRSKAV